MSLNIVILAAGQGKRMYSDLPKVLHPLAGKPLLRRVLDTARELAPARLVVVYGHGGARVRQAIPDEDLLWALQAEQKGTGHALAQALPHLDPGLPTLTLCGDAPLVRPRALENLCRAARETGEESLGILTVCLDNPQGYGRIVRDSADGIRAVVEEKDADEAIRAIREVNTGIFLLPTRRLGAWLSALKNDNAQGEYYLTDLVRMAVEARIPVRAAHPETVWEAEGVNDPAQLAALERRYQRAQAEDLLRRGVRLYDPERIDIRGQVVCGRDVSIDVGCVFEGRVELADGVSVGPYCVIRAAKIGARTKIEAFTHMDGAILGADCAAGPYARLRPGTVLEDGARAGNFVEIKNTRLGAGSKANHLSYLGDADVGARVNVGAGVITCNYDGVNKHKTVIGDEAFIGSDCQLVAPVKVGAGAILGAGTTLRKNAPANMLTAMQSRAQVSIPPRKQAGKEEGAPAKNEA
ncbi:MAG: bifunctional UDP-N-acetylglucosamine diphosphorylase/glucosamine-1-phosphate N-acetyltransferase GlmU [Zoogloeaceae bacterium]|jgi:bifunctional UDP-N-acetylglucosamine pyrophosphorylase/glucosamine-1-phosphate N-acetyltransferase|nr:bifunctional UDP-N-acetylglucosamine diphosphorylase/glucosamine-1-phosphate N-acetyltransferase GlmU [Zoogloeaceae bacterium]